jgi:tripartite-type tricarboxylate transporter receptor subunit TctC
MKETGIQTKVVPYDGGGPALMAILGGHIDVMLGQVSHSLPHIKSGKLRLIAFLDNQRDPDFPDVPTAKEEGVNVVYHMWRGVLAPKGTPRPVIDKLALSFKKMTEDKSVTVMIKQLGDRMYYLDRMIFQNSGGKSMSTTRNSERFLRNNLKDHSGLNTIL